MENEKIKRLKKWANGEKAPPFTLDINPTDKCNLKCLSCWQRGFKNVDSSYELSDEKLIGIVKEAIELGVMEFEITGGGEPLIRKGLVLQIMGLVKGSDRMGNITTNGTLFSDEGIRKIVTMGWDRITFSIDGPDAETSDFLRGKGSFDMIMKSISLFNTYKKSCSSKDPIIKFNTVLSNKNYEKAIEMIELAHKVGCEIVSFEPLTVHSDFGRKLKLNEEEIEKFNSIIPKAKKLAEDYKIYTNIDGLIKTQFIEKSNKMVEVIKEDSKNEIEKNSGFALVPCFEPWWHLVIKVDGSVQPCCLYDIKDDNVKDKSLKEIWFGETFQRIRKSIMDRKFSKYCSICNAGQVLENRRIREILKTEK